jgi:hypothetical protein
LILISALRDGGRGNAIGFRRNRCAVCWWWARWRSRSCCSPARGCSCAASINAGGGSRLRSARPSYVPHQSAGRQIQIRRIAGGLLIRAGWSAFAPCRA